MSPVTHSNPNNLDAVLRRGMSVRSTNLRSQCRVNRRRVPALQSTEEPRTTSSTAPSHLRSSTAAQICQHIASSTPALPANSHAKQDVMDTDLPAGCAMGTPVPMGRPVMQVSVNAGALDLAVMRSIRGDNYKFIHHLILLGWCPANPRACNFAITAKLPNSTQSEVMNIRDASPLHYAICCGSFHAAAALLIAFPEMASTTCKVSASSDAHQGEFSAVDLARYLVNLYMHGSAQKLGEYQRAEHVIRALQSCPAVFPFVSLPTPQARLGAAGKDPRAVTAALCAAAAITPEL